MSYVNITWDVNYSKIIDSIVLFQSIKAISQFIQSVFRFNSLHNYFHKLI